VAQRYGVITINLRRELEQLHEASLAWTLYCCRHRTEEAEDLLHEVYLRVLDGRARFDGQSSFKTWLFAVIRRTTRERARTRWLHLNLLERWLRAEADPNREPEPAQRLHESERTRRFRGALRRLARRQQEILLLVFYHDLTLEESAKMVGISLGSARTHFARGKQRLRELLQTENDDER
jgi:RNA polymerase sigma-70 factor (ECF subfamily)